MRKRWITSGRFSGSTDIVNGPVTKEKVTPAEATLEEEVETAPPPREEEAVGADPLTNEPMPTEYRIPKWKRPIVIPYVRASPKHTGECLNNMTFQYTLS